MITLVELEQYLKSRSAVFTPQLARDILRRARKTARNGRIHPHEMLEVAGNEPNLADNLSRLAASAA